MAVERGGEDADVIGEVGVVEDVESGDAEGHDAGVVVAGFGEVDIVVVEEIDRGGAPGLEGVATDA